MSFNSVPEVPDAAREGNPSTWLPPDFERPTTENGLPKRTAADVFDKGRLRPGGLSQEVASSDENSPVDEAMGVSTVPYVPKHSTDLEAWKQAGKAPEDMRRVARIGGGFGSLVQMAEAPSAPSTPERRRPTLAGNFRSVGGTAVSGMVTTSDVRNTLAPVRADGRHITIEIPPLLDGGLRITTSDNPKTAVWVPRPR